MENFRPTLHQTEILIRKNGCFTDSGRIICVEHNWSFTEFLRIGSERLDLLPRAVRAFTIDGAEITDCMMIGDMDSIFLSGGEAFISPAPTTYVLDLAHKRELNEHNRMPSYVGMYNVGAILGSGAFGEVRLGTNKLTDEKVALKFLRKADIQSMGAAERTSNETQCLSSLSHRNIIKLFMRLEIHKYVVMVFDLMEGGDMFRFLNRRGLTAAEAALSDEEAREVFTQVLSGIDCAHKHRIIHRDLKLENLLLKDHTLRMVKIADFGLSQFCRPGVLIKGDGCGTLTSAAPELLSAKGCHAGPPIDVWAVGVVLFALLCGRLPFSGPNLTSEQPSPNQVRKNIIKCVYKIPDYVSDEAKDLLKRILNADPVERATVSQIFNHSWLRHRTDLSKEAEAELHELQMKMPTTRSFTELADLESTEHVTEPGSRGARDRHSSRRHAAEEDNVHSGRIRDRGELPGHSELEPHLVRKSSFLSLPVITPGGSNTTSPMRCSHPALDCLTDELDRNIFDRRPSLSASSTVSSDGSPSVFTARIHAVASKFGKSSLDRNSVSDPDDSGCDMKGWGAPRARNSVRVSAKSPTQTKTPTRNSSSDATMQMLDASEDLGITSTRRIASESFKISGKYSSFSFKYSPSTTISTSATSTTSSSRNGSTRAAPQLSPNAFSDELDKRLSGLERRMS